MLVDEERKAGVYQQIVLDASRLAPESISRGWSLAKNNS